MRFNQLKRREFITLVGGVAAWPLSARAQQAGKVYRIGFLANDPAIPTQPAGEAFLDGLRESGFVEGKNVIIERRFAEGRGDRSRLTGDFACADRPSRPCIRGPADQWPLPG
jgi:hypothetical protein